MRGIGVIGISGFEQRYPDRLGPHPRLGVGIVLRAIFLDPQRCGRRHLWRGRRRARTVEINRLRRAEPGPRHVGRIGRDRGRHLLGRAVVARHQRRRQVGIRLAVRHGPAGRDNPVEPGRVDDVVRWQIGVIVSGRRDHEHAKFIERIDGVGPGLRGQAAHAHGHDVNKRFRLAAKRVNVVERLSDGAVSKQHDAVGYPDRNNFGARGAAESGLTGGRRACQDAERAGAMAEIVQQSVRTVGRVVREIVVDEIALQVGSEEGRPGRVIGIVAGIEMGDPDALAGAGIRKLADGAKAAVDRIPKPVIIRVGRERGILLFGVALPDGEGGFAAQRRSDRPFLLQIRFDDLDPAGCEARALLRQGVTQLPLADVRRGKFGLDNVPIRCGSRGQPTGAPDAREQRLDVQFDRRVAETELHRSGQHRSGGLHEKTDLSFRTHTIAPWSALKGRCEAAAIIDAIGRRSGLLWGRSAIRLSKKGVKLSQLKVVLSRKCIPSTRTSRTY